MVLLRKFCEFGSPIHDLKTIYVTYIRSILEQSAVVWHSGLSEENKQDLSRVQKSACKIILKNNYKDYENALNILDLETLNERRNKLCETFAKKCVTSGTISFLLIDKSKYINTRSTDKYIVQHCNTERLKQISHTQYAKITQSTWKTTSMNNYSSPCHWWIFGPWPAIVLLVPYITRK